MIEVRIMPVKVFRIQGTYIRLNKQFKFSREVRAMTEEQAREQLYTEIGSFHRVKRQKITINQVTEIPPTEAKSLVIRRHSGIE
jgi:large subunit ribosomal protein LX